MLIVVCPKKTVILLIGLAVPDFVKALEHKPFQKAVETQGTTGATIKSLS